MIEAILKRGAESASVQVRCDSCSASIVMQRPRMGGFADGRALTTKEHRVITSRASRDHGWHRQGKKLLCQSCKPPTQELTLVPKPIELPAVPHPIVEGVQALQAMHPPVVEAPTRDQRRVISDKLSMVYQPERHRYIGKVSDRALAEELKLPKAWIAEIRVQFFGDHDRNEAEDQTKTFIAVMEKRLAAAEDQLLKLLTGRDTMERAINNQAQILDVMRADFDKFSKERM